MESKNAKFIIGIIIVLIIIILVGGFILLTRKEEATENKGNNTQSTIQNKTEDYVREENGVKTNISQAFAKERTIDGLIISNIKLTELNNLSKITAEIKNPTNQAKGNFSIKLRIKDKDGKILAELNTYIGNIKPGDVTELKVSGTVDFANAYDFEIVKM